MGSFSSGDEECWFFDACEDISRVSDSESESSECSCSGCGFEEWESSCFQYNVWRRNRERVQERRSKFFRWMGLSLDGREGVEVLDVLKGASDRIMEKSGAVLRNSISHDCASSSQSFESSLSNNDFDSHRGSGLSQNFVCRMNNYNGGAVCNDCYLGKASRMGSSQLLGLTQRAAAENFESTAASSPPAQQFVQSQIDVGSYVAPAGRRMKNRWLSRLHSMSCIIDMVNRGYEA